MLQVGVEEIADVFHVEAAARPAAAPLPGPHRSLEVDRYLLSGSHILGQRRPKREFDGNRVDDRSPPGRADPAFITTRAPAMGDSIDRTRTEID